MGCSSAAQSPQDGPCISLVNGAQTCAIKSAEAPCVSKKVLCWICFQAGSLCIYISLFFFSNPYIFLIVSKVCSSLKMSKAIGAFIGSFPMLLSVIIKKGENEF